jgi:hypothetical protein
VLQGRLTLLAVLPVTIVGALALTACGGDDTAATTGATAATTDTGASLPADPPIATLDIVTEIEPLDADELYATFDEVQIASVGGEACARELAEIVAAAEHYLAERATDPAGIGELVAAGYLDEVPTRWTLDGDELVPAAGSGCADLG